MMCSFEGCVKQAQHGGRCLRHQAPAPAPTRTAEPEAMKPPPVAQDGIEWEDPPPSAIRGRKSRVDPFLDALAAHPGKWAVWTRSAKSSSAASTLTKAAKGRGLVVECATRSNGDGTRAAWARVVEA